MTRHRHTLSPACRADHPLNAGPRKRWTPSVYGGLPVLTPNLKLEAGRSSASTGAACDRGEPRWLPGHGHAACRGSCRSGQYPAATGPGPSDLRHGSPAGRDLYPARGHQGRRRTHGLRSREPRPQADRAIPGRPHFLESSLTENPAASLSESGTPHCSRDRALTFPTACHFHGDPQADSGQQRRLTPSRSGKPGWRSTQIRMPCILAGTSLSWLAKLPSQFDRPRPPRWKPVPVLSSPRWPGDALPAAKETRHAIPESLARGFCWTRCGDSLSGNCFHQTTVHPA